MVSLGLLRDGDRHYIVELSVPCLSITLPLHVLYPSHTNTLPVPYLSLTLYGLPKPHKGTGIDTILDFSHYHPPKTLQKPIQLPLKKKKKWSCFNIAIEYSLLKRERMLKKYLLILNQYE